MHAPGCNGFGNGLRERYNTDDVSGSASSCGETFRSKDCIRTKLWKAAMRGTKGAILNGCFNRISRVTKQRKRRAYSFSLFYVAQESRTYDANYDRRDISEKNTVV